MKILFLGPLNSTFVKNDIDILSKQHDLTLINTAVGGGLNGIKNLIKLSLTSIKNLFSNDAVFCWFADYTSFIPVLTAKILKKKSYIIAGGFDVSYISELNYGAKARRLRWFCVRSSFALADKVFPVSKYAENGLKNLTGLKKVRSKMIYNCIDTKKYPELQALQQRKLVITVSQADSYLEYIIKGGDSFIKIAKANPQYNFILAGLRDPSYSIATKEAESISNLKILRGPLDLYKDIIPMYANSFAYIQASLDATFGVAVIEAMYCGAYPIVSNRGALAEIIGSYGCVCNSIDEYSKALQFAFTVDSSYRTELRNYVKIFDRQQRENALLAEV